MRALRCSSSQFRGSYKQLNNKQEKFFETKLDYFLPPVLYITNDLSNDMYLKLL